MYVTVVAFLIHVTAVFIILLVILLHVNICNTFFAFDSFLFHWLIVEYKINVNTQLTTDFSVVFSLLRD